MKYPIVVALGATIAIGGMLYLSQPLAELFNSTKVEQQVIVEEKEVEVDQLQKAVDEALKAAKADIESKAQAAYDSTFEMESKKVELEVRRKLQAEQESMIIDLEKEVGEY